MRDREESPPVTESGDLQEARQELLVLLKNLERAVRFTVSNDSVLTLTEAANLLHGRAATNRQWIRQHVIPLSGPSKRDLYRWGDIVAELKEAA